MDTKQSVFKEWKGCTNQEKDYDNINGFFEERKFNRIMAVVIISMIVLLVGLFTYGLKDITKTSNNKINQIDNYVR
jgi:hypothetical protein